MKLLKGDYADVIDDYIIVDCRYPFEFEGGHIKVSRLVLNNLGSVSFVREKTGEQSVLLIFYELFKRKY